MKNILLKAVCIAAIALPFSAQMVKAATITANLRNTNNFDYSPAGYYYPTVKITLSDEGVPAGTVKVKVEVVPGETGGIGDLRGVFFNLPNGVTNARINQTGGGPITATKGVTNSFGDFENSNNLTGSGGANFDVGIEVGKEGIGGNPLYPIDDFRSTEFTISGNGLTLAGFSQAQFGARMTSVNSTSNVSTSANSRHYEGNTLGNGGTVVTPSLANLAVGSINLRNGITTGNFSNNFVSFVKSPTIGHNGYYETVLKITLDPNYLFTKAIFDIKYDADPNGMTVNIGDSITNNGYGGDGSTQSNDAEMQIGNLTTPSSLASERNDMLVFGNDYFNNKNSFIQFSDIVTSNNTISTASPVSLVVSNQSLAWNNNNGLLGAISSPYLYALGGQPDSEGPINYDIFASFNRSISSSDRWGTGVSEVKITLSAAESVPEPTTALDFCLAVGVGAFLKRRNSKKQNPA